MTFRISILCEMVILPLKVCNEQFEYLCLNHTYHSFFLRIENVIIIKNGEIIKNDSRDEILKAGYCISGISSAVDGYISGKQVIGTEILGGLKTAYILGQPETNIPDNLSISGMDLQKFFIQLTNS